MCKHYPAQSNGVSIPPYKESEDTLRSMTVLPYLDDFHNPPPESEENEYEHYIRTHYCKSDSKLHVRAHVHVGVDESKPASLSCLSYCSGQRTD